jgi:2-polyprenyl-3-methyl-5-hydroxy-6-metoxy-1,4-benzoquinol methylase
MKELQKKWKDAAISDNCNGFISANCGDNYYESGQNSAFIILETAKKFQSKEVNKLTIIDFGCGNGRVSIPLSEFVKTVYAVDFVPEMVNQIISKSNIERITTEDGTADFNIDEKADIGFTISVFIHNTYIDGCKIVESISKNIKPGGLLFLDIPLYEKSKEPKHWIDVGVWTFEQLKDCAEKNNLLIIESWQNDGEFGTGNIGVNHGKFNILKKL